MSTLLGDPTLNPVANCYDVASYKRIWAEFGIDPSSDFCFTLGKNHRLGDIYVYVQGAMKTDYDYSGWMKFGDEGGKVIKGDLISYIRPDAVAATQYDWFTPKTATG